MSYKNYYSILLIAAAIFSGNLISCSKGGSDSPADPCAGKTITLTATATPSNGCGGATGSITASATGSSGFTYKVGSGAFQASGIFNGIAPGNHVVTVKDVDGCTKTQSVAVTSTGNSFTITTSTTPTSGCNSTDGSVTITATGSTGYQYKLEANGTYGASNIFNNLASGAHTVFVKDAAGCENSQAINITASTTPGPKFTAVRNLINAKCISCHSGAAPAGNRDWTVNCNVVINKTLINNRAVIVGDMPQGGPPLSAAEKQIITDWINAGGLLTN